MSLCINITFSDQITRQNNQLWKGLELHMISVRIFSFLVTNSWDI